MKPRYRNDSPISVKKNKVTHNAVQGEDLDTRLSKGGQGGQDEEVRRRFSIVGACLLGLLVEKPLDISKLEHPLGWVKTG